MRTFPNPTDHMSSSMVAATAAASPPGGGAASPRKSSGPDGDYTPQAEFNRATSSAFEPQRQPPPTDTVESAAATAAGGSARSTRSVPGAGGDPSVGAAETAKLGPIRHLWDRVQKVTDSSYLYPVLSLLVVCILTLIVVFAPGVLLWYKFGSVLLSVIFAAFTYRHCRKRGGVVVAH